MTRRTEALFAAAPRQSPPRPMPPSAAIERRIGRLNLQIQRTLGHQVLPLIMTARRGPGHAELDSLAARAIAGDTGALTASVKELQQAGMNSERICLEFLTPLARRLGEWWEEDRCGFVEVTLGLVALQQILRELAPSLGGAAPAEARRSALMVPMPGEQHGFGISMVAEFFRAAGWQVAQDAGNTLRDLERRVARDWFGVVALSCGVSERLARLPAVIAAVRAHSFNPDVVVMVGGAALQGNDAPALAADADATARDAAEALRRAESLVGLPAFHP